MIGEITGNSHFFPDAKTAKGPNEMTNIPSPLKTLNMHHHHHQVHHLGQTNTGTNTGHQNCPSTHTTTIRNGMTQTEDGQTPGNRDQQNRTKHQKDTKNQKINITAETLNCHGFAQSSEYVVNRLKSCNILCLQETWIWPHEISLISDTISNHPDIRNSSQEYTVISKCGMHDREPDYSGRGYGGVTVIVKNNINFSIKEIKIASDRIVAVGLYDKHDKLIHVICSVYLPYFDGDKTRLAQCCFNSRFLIRF